MTVRMASALWLTYSKPAPLDRQTDSENALNDVAYKRVCRSTMAKCSGLWNKASRSTHCADVVSEKLKTSLIVPNDTRWNSHFPAMEKIKHILEKTRGHSQRSVRSLGGSPVVGK